MSKKEGYSRKGLFGEIKHYDANGRKVGESRPNILGGYSNYDIENGLRLSLIESLQISLMSVRGYGESESPSRDLPGGMP